MNLPKTYTFGDNELIEILHLETTFGISRKVALRYLRALRIKPLYFGDGIYYSLPTFNRIMFVLSRPGSPGFIFPGSPAKHNPALRKKGFLVEVTDDILKEAAQH